MIGTFSEGESCAIAFEFYAVFLPDDALEVIAKPLHCREMYLATLKGEED
jgi:hypothetical protein